MKYFDDAIYLNARTEDKVLGGYVYCLGSVGVAGVEKSEIFEYIRDYLRRNYVVHDSNKQAMIIWLEAVDDNLKAVFKKQMVTTKKAF